MRRAVLVLLVLVALVATAGLVRWLQPLGGPSAAPSWYVRSVYPLEHARTIRSAAHRNGLDPTLVAAVIYAESRFDDHARSSKGAVGLMQVLPATARQIARETGGVAFVDSDLEDPQVNVRYGCYYLGVALDRFDGDIVAAVASYNAGIGAVEGWEKEVMAQGRHLRVADIPYDETRAYVERVLELRRVYRDTYGERLRTPSVSG